jgi:hypothetical protein
VGIDSNSNGVRDDVERLIAKDSANQKEFDKSMIIETTQEKLLMASEGDIPSIRKEIMENTCQTGKVSQKPEYLDAFLNNEERQKKYLENSLKMDGIISFDINCPGKSHVF